MIRFEAWYLKKFIVNYFYQMFNSEVLESDQNKPRWLKSEREKQGSKYCCLGCFFQILLLRVLLRIFGIFSSE